MPSPRRRSGRSASASGKHSKPSTPPPPPPSQPQQQLEKPNEKGKYSSPVERPGAVTPLGLGARTGTLFVLYASIAGTCGALSGVVGKIAVASALAPRIANSFVDFLAQYDLLTLCISLMGTTRSSTSSTVMSGLSAEEKAVEQVTFGVEVLLRVSFFLANAYFTGQMWRFFLKSLSLGPTPVSQIINTGTNFAVSAFLGLLFFHEEVNVTWAAGALLVIAGLALVVTDPEAAKATS